METGQAAEVLGIASVQVVQDASANFSRISLKHDAWMADAARVDVQIVIGADSHSTARPGFRSPPPSVTRATGPPDAVRDVTH